MFEYAISFITARTDHPFIASLFVLALCFAGIGILVETLVDNGAAAAFLVIYAMMAAVLGVLGYAILYALKLASMIQERAVSR